MLFISFKNMTSVHNSGYVKLLGLMFCTKPMYRTIVIKKILKISQAFQKSPEIPRTCRKVNTPYISI